MTSPSLEHEFSKTHAWMQIDYGSLRDTLNPQLRQASIPDFLLTSTLSSIRARLDRCRQHGQRLRRISLSGMDLSAAELQSISCIDLSPAELPSISLCGQLEGQRRQRRRQRSFELQARACVPPRDICWGSTEWSSHHVRRQDWLLDTRKSPCQNAFFGVDFRGRNPNRHQPQTL